MQVFEMVVLIVAIVTVGRIVRARYESGDRMQLRFPLMDSGSDNTEARRLREEVTTLKERIAVLERLATDDSTAVRLDREIEKLRDKN